MPDLTIHLDYGPKPTPFRHCDWIAKMIWRREMFKRNCGSCKYGNFQMTNHAKPRPKPGPYGQCRFDVEPLVNVFFSKLPEASTASYQWKAARQAVATGMIWPRWGNSCPVWEATS